MKATISSNGVLTITTDNDTEAYALAQWQKNSAIKIDEKWYYKGASIELAFVSNSSLFFQVESETDACGLVVVKDGTPYITGLDQHKKYKGVFASDGYKIVVDGISNEYGDITPTTWTGIPKHGELVKFQPN